MYNVLYYFTIYMNVNILGYIMISFIILICIKIYQESDTFQLKCIISDIDGKTYCVRDRSKLELAADKLAEVTNNMNTIVNHCKEKYLDRKNIKRLVDGYNPQKIFETLPTSKYTAYSENKGEKLAFCLDTEKNNGQLIDINTLTYVALHELAHIATKSIGHTDEFWNNFKFLITEAKTLNIYNPIDYKNNPVRYCGMTIKDNPYFDI